MIRTLIILKQKQIPKQHLKWYEKSISQKNIYIYILKIIHRESFDAKNVDNCRLKRNSYKITFSTKTEVYIIIGWHLKQNYITICVFQPNAK